MKKANMLVCYERDGNGVSVKNVYAVHRGGHDFLSCLSGKNYSSIYEAYSAVISVAKNNGFRIPYYDAFGARFYDILWIDCKTGAANKYSLH